MLNLTRPRYVMPMHGDYKRIRLHAELAESVGIEPQKIFRARNGVPLEIDADGARLGDHRRRDDLRRRPRPRRARRRRPPRPPHALGRRPRHRRRHGLDRGRRGGADPEITFRGVPFLEEDEADGLIDEIRDVVEATLDDAESPIDPL